MAARSAGPSSTVTTAVVSAPPRIARWAIPATLIRPPRLMLSRPAQYSPGSSPIRASAPSPASAARSRRDWSANRSCSPAVTSASAVTCSTTTAPGP